MSPPNLEVQDLLVRYSDGFGAVTALEIEQLHVPPGTLLALTGPSGSGKSTFLSTPSPGCCARRAEKSSGMPADILTEPELVRDRWRRLNIGFVFQDFHLLPELTPLENVLLPATFERLVIDLRGAGARPLAARSLFSVPQARRTAAGAFSRGEPASALRLRARCSSDPASVTSRTEPDGEPRCRRRGRGGLTRWRGFRPPKACTVIAVTHDPVLISRCTRRAALDHGHVCAPRSARSFRREVSSPRRQGDWIARHPGTYLLFVVLVALATAIGVATTAQERRPGAGAQPAPLDKFDLVVAAPGSQTDVVGLAAIDPRPGTVPLLEPAVVGKALAEPAVRISAPLGFGDRLSRRTDRRHGAGLSSINLSGGLQQGRLFATEGEAVAGAATRLAIGAHLPRRAGPLRHQHTTRTDA